MDTIDFNAHDDWDFATFENWSFFTTNFKHLGSVRNDLVKWRIASNTSKGDNIQVVEGGHDALGVINSTVCVNDIWFFECIHTCKLGKF